MNQMEWNTLLFNAVIVWIGPRYECHSKPITNVWSIDDKLLHCSIRFELKVAYLESVK